MATNIKWCLSKFFIISGTLIIHILQTESLRCFNCLAAPVQCDKNGTGVCTHNCTEIVECPSSVCTAALYIESPLVMLMCFPKHEHTKDACILHDNITCSCEKDYCTHSLYPRTTREEILPPLAYNKFVPTDIPLLTRPERENPPPLPQYTQSDDEDRGVNCSISDCSNDSTALSLILVSSVLFIITIGSVSIVIKRQRIIHNNKLKLSETNSTMLGTEGSDTKGPCDTPPDSPTMSDSEPDKELKLEVVVGRGRFGAVWKADCLSERYPHQHVAVKVFYEFDSTSWNAEKELFSDPSVDLRHENIINFLEAMVHLITYPKPQKQYWLITEYYEKGSLQEYISCQTVNWQEFCCLVWCASKGLAHLHSDRKGEEGQKYPVAHRDLKSSNILVRDNGSCVIADFGLAIKLDPRANVQDLANSGQAGTPRYMPPEALESKINLQEIESFKQIDVYALALIIWEVGRRCDVVGDVPDYELPYTEHLNDRRPSLDEMRSVVVRRKERPTIPPSWKEIAGMSFIRDMIMECWDDEPEARLTSSCVERRLYSLKGWIDGKSTQIDTFDDCNV